MTHSHSMQALDLLVTTFEDTADKITKRRPKLTELDDAKLFRLVNTNIIPKFDMGVQLRLILNPDSVQNYTANFRVCCKYGLNTFIESYFDSILIPYKQLLEESLFPQVICEIIGEYLLSIITLMDLMVSTNFYGETALVLAAKYGQAETCKLVINRCRGNVPDHVIIGWINSSSSKATPLQWSLTSYSSDSWNKIKHKIMETIMVLLQNGALVCLRRHEREHRDSYQIAVDKGLDFEAKVLYAYLKVECGEHKTPLEYAKSVNDDKLFKFLQKYVSN